MRRVWKLIVAVLLMSALLLSVSGTALADPVNNPNAFTLTLTCGDQSITFVTPSGTAVVGQVIGTTSVGVVSQVELTFSYTDPNTGQPVTTTQTFILGAGHGNAQGLEDRFTTCSNTDTFEDPELGTVTVIFTLTQFLTPSG
jgi:hypothetical protein